MNPAENFNETYLQVLRTLPGERRLLLSFELFEMATRLTTAGIQSQHPTFTEEEVATELRKRISSQTGEVAPPRY